jgi:hypothetical protein
MKEHYCCPRCKLDITPDLVQLQNPLSHHWVVVDRAAAKIIKHSRTSTPYKHIIKVLGAEAYKESE